MSKRQSELKLKPKPRRGRGIVPEHLHPLMDALEQYARIQGMDTQPPIGTVLKWDIQFTDNGPTYSYVAIRSPKGWHTTISEKDGRPIEWRELLDFLFIENRNAFRKLWIESSWIPLFSA